MMLDECAVLLSYELSLSTRSILDLQKNHFGSRFIILNIQMSLNHCYDNMDANEHYS